MWYRWTCSERKDENTSEVCMMSVCQWRMGTIFDHCHIFLLTDWLGISVPARTQIFFPWSCERGQLLWSTPWTSSAVKSSWVALTYRWRPICYMYYFMPLYAIPLVTTICAWVVIRMTHMCRKSCYTSVWTTWSGSFKTHQLVSFPTLMRT